ncbi:hypothetical protein GZL_08567 [Streptomyces sp. 769]|nr:hypothetical protein GZL_08567 [Streptomyces sp. 769]
MPIGSAARARSAVAAGGRIAQLPYASAVMPSVSSVPTLTASKAM